MLEVQGGHWPPLREAARWGTLTVGPRNCCSDWNCSKRFFGLERAEKGPFEAAFHHSVGCYCCLLVLLCLDNGENTSDLLFFNSWLTLKVFYCSQLGHHCCSSPMATERGPQTQRGGHKGMLASAPALVANNRIWQPFDAGLWHNQVSLGNDPVPAAELCPQPWPGAARVESFIPWSPQIKVSTFI